MARKNKLPTADLSPEAQAERIRKYPPPRHDQEEVNRKAWDAALAFSFTVCSCFMGFMPQAPEASRDA